MTTRYDSADYELRWPRGLFVAEATALINHASNDDWSGRCEFLLEDAFSGPAPRDAVRTSIGSGIPMISNARGFLRDLVKDAGKLREMAERHRPYWSQRRSAGLSEPRADSQEATVGQFVAMILDFVNRGYFEKAFDKDCVDAPSDVDPSVVIEQALGVPDLWPPAPQRLTEDPDLFCDVVEVLHDLIARPRTRWMHAYAGCGWHHGDFSIEAGRTLYRWRVNRLLGRSDLGLHLADEGEDVGRLVTATDPARAELLRTAAQREDPIADRLRHAISLYRGRHATEHDKRSAVIVLSGVLEQRRTLIKKELLRKDEGDLFTIANTFAIRHQNEQQKSDYSVEFLDWIFWWYLATIELTDRLAAR
jgi:hypothetical protein